MYGEGGTVVGYWVVMRFLGFWLRRGIKEYRRARCILVERGGYNVSTQRLKDRIKGISISWARSVPFLSTCKNLYGRINEGLPASASRASCGVPRYAWPQWPPAARSLIRSTKEYLSWTSLKLFNYRVTDPLNLSIEFSVWFQPSRLSAVNWNDQPYRTYFS